MQRREQYPIVAQKYIFRPVAMMTVEVHNCDAADSQHLGDRNRNVIEITKPHHAIPLGVMSGRSHQ